MKSVKLATIGSMAGAGAGQIHQLFLHWSAGHYGQAFDDYHICIDKNGEIYAMHQDLTEVLAHTWNHNTGSVGLALLYCAGATAEDLGPEPPTDQQIDCMARVIAVLCAGLHLPCDFDHVRTYAEQADLDGYGPATTCERWDMWFLTNGDEPGTGGAIIREKAKWYMENSVST